jgi:hypothetical protein
LQDALVTRLLEKQNHLQWSEDQRFRLKVQNEQQATHITALLAQNAKLVAQVATQEAQIAHQSQHVSVDNMLEAFFPEIEPKVSSSHPLSMCAVCSVPAHDCT